MTETSSPDSSAPGGPQGTEDDSVAFEDLAYRAAVVDLLGAITYGEISAFERLADDAKLAEELPDKLALAKMATVQFAHVEPLIEEPGRPQALGERLKLRDDLVGLSHKGPPVRSAGVGRS